MSLDGPAGQPSPPRTVPRLPYVDGRLSIAPGCNSGSAEVEVVDDTVTFGPMALTRMACEGDVMEFEIAVVRMLGAPLEYTLESDELTLSDGESTLTLESSPQHDTARRAGFRPSGVSQAWTESGPRHAVDLLDPDAEGHGRWATRATIADWSVTFNTSVLPHRWIELSPMSSHSRS